MKIENGRMNLRRKQQLIYLIADLISSELVWICFLAFRWMVYDGRTVLLDDVLIPAFSFWLPMLVYPVICLVIYYLSGHLMVPRLAHLVSRCMVRTRVGVLWLVLSIQRILPHRTTSNCRRATTTRLGLIISE